MPATSRQSWRANEEQERDLSNSVLPLFRDSAMGLRAEFSGCGNVGGQNDLGVAERAFILRSRLGRSIFLLREDSLEITSHLFGAKSEKHIPIASISPDYAIVGWRNLTVVWLLFVPVALSIVAYRYLIHHPEIPETFLHYPLYFGATCAVTAIRFIPRFEAFVFKNHFNCPLFSILREAGQRAEAEAFVRALLDRIERLDGSAGEAALPDPLADEEAAAKEDDPNIPLWKLGIGLSVVSVALPPAVNWAWPDWDGIMLPLVIVCSGGSMVIALYAWAKKEPKRWWAVAAAIVALIPLFFY